MKFNIIKDNIELVAVLLFVCLAMGGYYFFLYREYNKTKNTYEAKKIVPFCPDYWSVTDSSNLDSDNPKILCRNEKQIGRCNLDGTPKDFSSELYKDDIIKCKWSKYCNSPWEGIDHLCADLTTADLE